MTLINYLRKKRAANAGKAHGNLWLPQSLASPTRRASKLLGVGRSGIIGRFNPGRLGKIANQTIGPAMANGGMVDDFGRSDEEVLAGVRTLTTGIRGRQFRAKLIAFWPHRTGCAARPASAFLL